MRRFFPLLLLILLLHRESLAALLPSPDVIEKHLALERPCPHIKTDGVLKVRRPGDEWAGLTYKYEGRACLVSLILGLSKAVSQLAEEQGGSVQDAETTIAEAREYSAPLISCLEWLPPREGRRGRARFYPVL